MSRLVRLAPLLLAHALGVEPLARHEVGAVVDAGEEPFEQLRLADEDVHHVDAAVGVGRLPPFARDVDERRDRLRLVGQEQVVTRRNEPEREREAAENDDRGDEAAGSGQSGKSHRLRS